MKKLAILLIIGFLAIPYLGYSQAFMKGTKTVNLGVNTGYGIGLVGSVEAGVNDNVSAGVIASFSGRGYGGYRYSYLVLGARGSYHLGTILEDAGVNMDKLDVYLGLTAGFRSVRNSFDYIGYNGAGTGIYIGGHGGVRYQLNDKLGVYLEGGYPLSSAGITFKF